MQGEDSMLMSGPQEVLEERQISVKADYGDVPGSKQ